MSGLLALSVFRLPIAATLVAALVVGGAFQARSATLDGLAVEVTGASEAVLCAEKDNVTLNFTSPAVHSFRIEAVHPAYITGVQRDSFAADWTACDLSADPAHASAVKTPTRRTLYEEPDFWLVGWTMPTYWRSATASVRVGDRVENGLHLLQLWMIRPMGGEEVLVLYPQDGYWRLRPLAPAGQAATAFGSSFLVGPVEIEGRPIVRIKEVVFDPRARSFTLAFERGGSATVVLATVDQSRNAVQITLDQPVSGRPFAALRSMYVTDYNNDVARIAVRDKGAKGWREEAIMTFKKALATDVWAGRATVSRHNSSSPDLVFSGFQSDSPAKPAPKRP